MRDRNNRICIDKWRTEALPETESLRCVTVYIPDSDEAASVLAGLLAQATNYWNFIGSDEDRRARADKFLQGYVATDWGGCMDCDGVADCIENDPDARSAVNSVVNNSWVADSPNGQPIPQSVMDAPLFDLSTCDANRAWGNAQAIVIESNRRIEDFLETVAALTNNQDLLSYIVGAIPVLETLPVDEMLVIAKKVQNWLRDAYAAGYDLDYELERACDLFCMIMAKEECELTYQEISDYFINRAQEIAVFTDAFTTATNIISAWANWDETFGEIVADAMMGMQFGFLNFLNSAFGYAFSEFKIKANAGVPDDDWQENCNDCPQPWVFTTDWRIEVKDWVIGAATGVTGAGGTRIEGTGIVTTNVSGSENAFAFRNLASAYTGTVNVKTRYSQQNAIVAFQVYAYDEGGGSAGFGSYTTGQTGIDEEQSVSFNVTAATRFAVNMNGFWVGASGNVLKAIEFTGTGDVNPFIDV
jgi:hypothetical protein